MGKKKAVGAKPAPTDPEKLKEAGNKAFLSKDYKQAITYYSEAINLTQDSKPNHIYHANRANAFLELGNFCAALDDCKFSI